MVEATRNLFTTIINDLRGRPGITVNDQTIELLNRENKWPGELNQYNQITGVLSYLDAPLVLSSEVGMYTIKLNFPPITEKKLGKRSQYTSIPSEPAKGLRNGSYYYALTQRVRSTTTYVYASSCTSTDDLYNQVVETYKKWQVKQAKNTRTDAEWKAWEDKAQKALDVKNAKLRAEAINRANPNRTEPPIPA